MFSEYKWQALRCVAVHGWEEMLAYKDFQTETPGTQLGFPYALGSGATIESVQSSSAPSGYIRLEGGFVGLDAGDRVTIVFDPPVTAFRLLMLCGANPTVATIVDESGAAHPPITLIKTSLNTGSISFAAFGISSIKLDHSNREGMLLRFDWESREDDVRKPSPGSLASLKAVSHEKLTGMLYALTAGWRSLPEKALKLDEARIELASSILGGMAAVEAIVPTENDLKHPMVRTIWESCLATAAVAMSTRKRTEIAVIERYSDGDPGLGRFVDLNSSGAEVIAVTKRANSEIAK